jgi:signal peptidase I
MQSKRAESRFAALRRTSGAALAAVLIACGWCYGVLFIEGGSMAPAVSAGDFVVYRRVSPRLATGDLVVFEHAGTLVVHRVAALLRDGGLRTRGDANRSLDALPVDAADVRGEVVLVVPTGAVVSRLAATAR